jgi:hypothetical protein
MASSRGGSGTGVQSLEEGGGGTGVLRPRILGYTRTENRETQYRRHLYMKRFEKWGTEQMKTKNKRHTVKDV